MEIKIPDRLERPGTHSVLRAMITSNVGLFVLVVLYAANLFAAYEVSVFRAQSRALVCALAAIPVLGVLAPVVFLAMPTRMAHRVEDEVAPEVTAAATQTFAVPGQRAAVGASEPRSALPQARAGAGHTTGTVPTSAQVFQRGAYTFNRRFFETRFAGFFAMIRRDAEKDMLMVIKTTRSQVVGQRITRITGNELHLLVPKGVAGEEVAVAFVDIQEISLKHKDA